MKIDKRWVLWVVYFLIEFGLLRLTVAAPSLTEPPEELRRHALIAAVASTGAVLLGLSTWRMRWAMRPHLLRLVALLLMGVGLIVTTLEWSRVFTFTGFLKNQKRPPIVLVHGAHADGRVWYAVQTALLKSGFRTSAPTLPGRPEFSSPTLAESAQALCKEVSEPSTLVGHSQAGAILAEMAGACPDKIKKLIYVTAVLPGPGENIFQQFSDADQGAYGQAVDLGVDRSTPKSPDALFSVFEPGLKPEVYEGLQVYPEPSSIGASAALYDAVRFESIPKVYVLAEKDAIITPVTQMKFINKGRFKRVRTIGSGHLPMLSQSSKLAKLVDREAA